MKIFTSLKATISSKFENVLSQVENHEAVVTAAIRETREAAAGAKVRLNRVRRDCERMNQRLIELRSSEKAWILRAVQVHPTDPAKALECVRRRNAVLKEISHLETEITRHTELELQLTRDLTQIEERVVELDRRRTACSAREFRARALSPGDASAAGVADVEEVFDRWEVKLTSTEPIHSASADSLEAQFTAEEDRAALESQLEELLRANRS